MATSITGPASHLEAHDPRSGDSARSSFRPGQHLPALDGLRGLAVALVLIYHVFQAVPAPVAGLPRLLYMATRIGQTGVDLFFVLSGFLITGILHDTKGAGSYFRNFYGRRTVRIFPLYYGVLLVVLVLLPRLVGHRLVAIDAPWFWTYTANLPIAAGANGGLLGHFWTLAIEEQFYLVWPAVVFAFGRPALIRICLGCIAGAAALRLALAPTGLASGLLAPCRMDSLTLGALLALAARGPDGVAGWSRKAIGVIAILSVVTFPLYVLKSGSSDTGVQVVKFTLIAALYAAVLALAVAAREGSRTGRFLRLRPLRDLGKYSYGIYVYHPFMIRLFVPHFEAPGGGSTPPTAAMLLLEFGLILAASLAAAWLSWQLFERPFLTLKRYFAYVPTTAEGEQASPAGAGLPESRGASPLRPSFGFGTGV